jgi:DNA-binding response OmpR family regulator
MKKILITDDSKLTLEILKDIFKEKGYQVVTAGLAEECLKVVKNENPDIILSDINLPEIDGFMLCSKLRNEFDFKNKIILMTGNMACVDAVKAFEQGADDFCVKTGDMLHVINTIENIMNEDNS